MATKILSIGGADLSNYVQMRTIYDNITSSQNVAFTASQSAIALGTDTTTNAYGWFESSDYIIGNFYGYKVKKITFNLRHSKALDTLIYLTLWGQQITFEYTSKSGSTYYDYEYTPTTDIYATSAYTIRIETPSASSTRNRRWLKSITIELETDDPLQAALSPNSLSLAVGGTETASLTVTGGSGTYYVTPNYFYNSSVSISGSGGNYTVSVTGLSEGDDYGYITVTDSHSNGMLCYLTVAVIASSALSVTASPNPCIVYINNSTSTVSLYVSGGTAPYTVTASGASHCSIVDINENSIELAGNSVGTDYINISVTDATSTTVTETLTANVEQPFTITVEPSRFKVPIGSTKTIVATLLGGSGNYTVTFVGTSDLTGVVTQRSGTTNIYDIVVTGEQLGSGQAFVGFSDTDVVNQYQTIYYTVVSTIYFDNFVQDSSPAKTVGTTSIYRLIPN